MDLPPVSFAHAQSVVTPQDRHEQQPTRHAEGRYVLILDGWLANREDLSRQLFNAPPDTGFPDSRILAAALLRWGEQALVRLHGDYTFAWWDTLERRLLLVCDRTGGRTLYYHVAQDGLLFANLLDTLFGQPDVPRHLNPDKVAKDSFQPIFDVSETCFHGIHQLAPSHKLVWTPTEMRVERYWHLDPHRRIRFPKDEDYVEAARSLLDQVVLESLRVEGPVLCNLSGGLDSSAVASTAARLLPSLPVHTVTWRPEPGSAKPADNRTTFFDEWPHAQAVAASYPNMVCHMAEARLIAFDDELRDNISFTGHPPVNLMATSWFSGMWPIAQGLGAKAVVGGLSGNCTLTTDALSGWWTSVRLADMPSALAEARLRARLTPGWRGWLRASHALLAPWWRYLSAQLQENPAPWRMQSPLREGVARRIGMDTLWRDFAGGDPGIPRHLRRRLWCMEHTWQGRAWMSPLRWRFGVERRDPLGDIRLAEFCLGLPLDQFVRPGMNRALARRVLADRLPDAVLHERRKGRQMPEWFDWLTRSRPWLVKELDRIEASPLARDLIDLPRLRAILDDWPADVESAEDKYSELMHVLGRGVALGIYTRWAEGDNE